MREKGDTMTRGLQDKIITALSPKEGIMGATRAVDLAEREVPLYITSNTYYR